MLFVFFPIALFLNDAYKPLSWLCLMAFLSLLIPLQYDVSFLCFTLTNFTVTNTVCLALYFVLAAQSVAAFVKQRRQPAAVPCE